MNERLQHVSQDRLINETNIREILIEMVTKWEFILILLFLGVIIFFSNASPYFLDYFNMMNTTFNFMEKAIMALPMIFAIMCGDIDISIASTLALSSFGMGLASSMGAGTPEIVIIGLSIGIVAGVFNGLLVTGLKIPAIAVTLGSQSLFRGISQAFLEDKAFTKYPESFGYFGQGYVGDSLIPFELVLFLVLAVIMGFLLHKTAYGRKVYAIGNSSTAARFSGVSVNRIRFTNLVLNGLFAGIAAVLLTSRIGSTRPNIAVGWDMEAITLVVLGGVSIIGGKGNIFGVIIAVFLLGYLKFGMGLLNFSAKSMIITTGFLLIAAVLIPEMLNTVKAKRKLRKQQG
ncbi:ABC transporter permease [Oceanispirochaeta crateris]|uniref:Autoinducer 2 import system permease protein LsrD n=1 Tax=Oceanispirochaeta crateris TaxID=2518645 RepID=A0A5C1QNG8_9SPIO|nr:ABC transporter permease [Oceanispirochaeta crateris]QEN09503.1 ABC transporter permease [Oceanispirochaeta crateris]